VPDTTGFIKSHGQRLQKALALAGEEMRRRGDETSRNRQKTSGQADVTLDNVEGPHLIGMV